MLVNILNYISLNSDNISYEENIIKRINLIKDINKEELNIFLETVKTNKYKNKEINLENHINILSNKIYELLPENKKHNFITNFFNCRYTKIYMMSNKFINNKKNKVDPFNQFNDFLNFFDEKKYNFTQSQINKIISYFNFYSVFMNFKNQDINSSYINKLRKEIFSVKYFNIKTLKFYLKSEQDDYLQDIKNKLNNVNVLKLLETELDNRLKKNLLEELKVETEEKINRQKRKI